MRNLPFILLLFLLANTLFSLELWDNQDLLQLLNLQELEALSLSDQDQSIVPLFDTIPLYESIQELQIHSGEDFLIIKDAQRIAESSIQIIEGQSFYISGPYRFENPEKIVIHGQRLLQQNWSVWLEPDFSFLENEIRIFSELHQLQVDIQYKNNIGSTVASAWFSGSALPDMLLFYQLDYPQLKAYLEESNIKSSTLVDSNMDFPLGIPLFYQSDPIMWESTAPVDLCDQFFARFYNGEQPEQLLQELSLNGFSNTAEIDRYLLILGGFPSLKQGNNRVGLSFMEYINRRYPESWPIDENRFLYNEMNESGWYFPPTWNSLELRDKMLPLLPLVRSKLLKVDEAYVIIEELNQIIQNGQ